MKFFLSTVVAIVLSVTGFAAQQTINVGTSANDHSGDTLRQAFVKTNANFTELYSNFPLDSDLISLAAASTNGTFYYRFAAGDWRPITIHDVTFSSGVLSAPTLPETFVDGAARTAATPSSLFQIGIQRDSRQLYYGASLVAGSWSSDWVVQSIEGTQGTFDTVTANVTLEGFALSLNGATSGAVHLVPAEIAGNGTIEIYVDATTITLHNPDSGDVLWLDNNGLRINGVLVGTAGFLNPSANVNTLLGAANYAAFRTSLGLGSLATLNPGTNVATALTNAIGTAGAPVLFNGLLGTPSSGTISTGVTIALSSVTLTGTVPTARLGSGTASSGTYLRGDSTWQAISTGLTIGTTTIASGTSGRFLYDNAGALGERTPAQVLSDIGAQASGSYAVTNTGNTFTGTQTFANGHRLTLYNSGTTTAQATLYGANIGGGQGALIFGCFDVDGVTPNYGTITGSAASFNCYAGVLTTSYCNFPLNGGLQYAGTDVLTMTATGIAIAVKASKYNNITTVSNGIPSEYATVDLTAQTAAVSATTAYTPAATGMYRVSVYLQVTTAASTSSVLGGATGVVLTYNDGDGNVAQSDTVALMTTAGAIAISSATNTTGTNLTGSMIIYARAGVAIQYAIGYTSVGVTPMQYAAHLKVEAL